MHESILKTLSEEHGHLFLLLEELEHAPTIYQRSELYNQVKAEIVPHMRGEELTIYEKLREDIADKKALELARISDRDHHRIREFMQKLELLDIETAEWVQTFKQFRSFTEDHCKDEEEELFPTAKDDFSEVELEEIAYEFEEAKHH
jgi:hemerythrin-like domain-containing protein